jgi:hypothetical protein
MGNARLHQTPGLGKNQESHVAELEAHQQYDLVAIASAFAGLSKDRS